MTVVSERTLHVAGDERPSPIATRIRQRHSVPAPAYLTVLLVVPLLMGWQRLRTAYWMDEALTVGIASHPLSDIPHVLLRDGSPPLYYLLLGLWTRVFGTSEAATHSLSLLFAMAVVPTAFWAARRLFDETAGWFAATFAAFLPFLHYFSGETRMYSLVVLESVVLCVAFSSAFIERTRRGPAFFAVALTLLLYTHYWGLYTAAGAALAVGVIAYLAPERRLLVRPALIGFGGAAVAFLPWLPTFLHQLGSTGAPWSHTPTLRSAISDTAALVRDERVLAVLSVVAGGGLIAVLAPARRALQRRVLLDGRAQLVVALSILLAAPIVIGWTLAHLQPSWATRYLAVIVGPIIVLVGIGLSRARGLGIAALVLTAIVVVQPFTRISPGIGIPPTSKSNAGALADAVRAEIPPGSLVLVAQPEAVPLFAHYLGSSYRYADPRGIVDDPTVMDWRDAGPALDDAQIPGALSQATALRPGDRLLLVTPPTRTDDTDTQWVQRFKTLARDWRHYFATQPCVTVVHDVALPSRQADPVGYPFRATVLECR